MDGFPNVGMGYAFAPATEEAVSAGVAPGLGRGAPAPAAVTRREESHNLLRSKVEAVGPDWIRAIAAPEIADVVDRWARGVFGTVVGISRGLWWHEFDVCYRFAGGVLMLRSLKTGRLAIEIQGGYLQDLTLWERCRLVRDLKTLGCRVTRLDLALDFRGEAVPLVDLVAESAEAGELCGSKSFEARMPRTGRKLRGLSASIGAKGKYGSGRFLRIYDKGLETGTEEARRWQRAELECGREGDCADQAATAITAAFNRVPGCKPVGELVVDLICSAFECRQVTGRRELARRPFAPWYAALVGWLRVTRHVIRGSAGRPVSLEKSAAWMRRSVAPLVLACAMLTGREPSEVVADLFAGVDTESVQRAAQRLPAMQYMRLLVGDGGPPIDACPGEVTHA